MVDFKQDLVEFLIQRIDFVVELDNGQFLLLAFLDLPVKLHLFDLAIRVPYLLELGQFLRQLLVILSKLLVLHWVFVFKQTLVL